MTERHYSGSHRSKHMTSSQRRKMARELKNSYSYGDRLRKLSDINHKYEEEQAEQELINRLSSLQS